MLTGTREADDVDKNARDVCGIRSAREIVQPSLARKWHSKMADILIRTEGLCRTCSSTTRHCEGCTGPQYGNALFEPRSIL